LNFEKYYFFIVKTRQGGQVISQKDMARTPYRYNEKIYIYEKFQVYKDSIPTAICRTYSIIFVLTIM